MLAEEFLNLLLIILGNILLFWYYLFSRNIRMMALIIQSLMKHLTVHFSFNDFFYKRHLSPWNDIPIITEVWSNNLITCFKFKWLSFKSLIKAWVTLLLHCTYYVYYVYSIIVLQGRGMCQDWGRSPMKTPSKGRSSISCVSPQCPIASSPKICLTVWVLSS